MSRSLSYLRRGLFGIAVVGSLGFGVTQALASTRSEWAPAGQDCGEYCTARYGEGTQPVYHYYNGSRWLCSCIK
jgi:hypothetical protein